MANSNPITPAEKKAAAYGRAQAMVEGILPDAGVRREALSLLADLVEVAHENKPKSWEITLYPTYIRLNVGMLPPLSLQAGNVSFLADLSRVDEPSRTRLKGFCKVVAKTGLKYMPDACWVATNYPHLVEARDLLRTGLQSATIAFSHTQRRTTFYKAHSTAIVDYMR